MTIKLTPEIANDLTVPMTGKRSASALLPVVAALDDSDGDGLPDVWERLHGLNPFDPTDAVGDLDGDGVSNLEEFRRGTNPRKLDAGLCILESCHP